jgi:hypothetical protein
MACAYSSRDGVAVIGIGNQNERFPERRDSIPGLRAVDDERARQEHGLFLSRQNKDRCRDNRERFIRRLGFYRDGFGRIANPLVKALDEGFTA